MIPNAWRTDHDGWDDRDRPTPSDLAHEYPIRPPLTGQARDEANARWVALGFPEYTHCDHCGDRCDICGDRMCATYGPEPAVTCGAHIECRDCHIDNTCRDCGDERGAA